MYIFQFWAPNLSYPKFLERLALPKYQPEYISAWVHLPQGTFNAFE